MALRRLRLADAGALVQLQLRADARRRGRALPDRDRAGDDVAPPPAGRAAAGTDRWEREVGAPGSTALGWFGPAGLEAALVAVPTRTDNGHGDEVPGWVHLSLLATDPDHWGRGLASRLLDHADLRIAEQGGQVVELWTQRDNLRARRLYERRGWARSRRLPALGEEGETLVHYERTLPAHLLRRARPIAR